MENDWNLTPVSVWKDIECYIEGLTVSTTILRGEIARISGMMTRSKTSKLEEMKNQLIYEERMLKWYKEQRQQKIKQTKIILDQILDFGFGCPTIQSPFEYTSEEFCQLLTTCRPIAEEAYDLRMRGFRCTLFY